MSLELLQAGLDPVSVRRLVEFALSEDLALGGDISGRLCLPRDQMTTATLVSRQTGILSGMVLLPVVLEASGLGQDVHLIVLKNDGDMVESGMEIGTLCGSALAIFAVERVMLNFLTFLSGTATTTRLMVSEVSGTNAKIVCTRKTIPSLRALQKYAVRCGGGFNHRFGLFDAVMLKDNHIAVAGGITEAVARARQGMGHMVKIEVEADTLPQVEEALKAGADCILLDNMSVEDMCRAVVMAKDITGGKVPLEASGGVRLDTVHAISEAGVDYISAGFLTHSSPALDIGLDIRAI